MFRLLSIILVAASCASGALQEEDCLAQSGRLRQENLANRWGDVGAFFQKLRGALCTCLCGAVVEELSCLHDTETQENIQKKEPTSGAVPPDLVPRKGILKKSASACAGAYEQAV